jgi:hypothetical protein
MKRKKKNCTNLRHGPKLAGPNSRGPPLAHFPFWSVQPSYNGCADMWDLFQSLTFACGPGAWHQRVGPIGHTTGPSSQAGVMDRWGTLGRHLLPPLLRSRPLLSVGWDLPQPLGSGQLAPSPIKRSPHPLSMPWSPPHTTSCTPVISSHGALSASGRSSSTSTGKPDAPASPPWARRYRSRSSAQSGGIIKVCLGCRWSGLCTRGLSFVTDGRAPRVGHVINPTLVRIAPFILPYFPLCLASSCVWIGELELGLACRRWWRRRAQACGGRWRCMGPWLVTDGQDHDATLFHPGAIWAVWFGVKE